MNVIIGWLTDHLDIALFSTELEWVTVAFHSVFQNIHLSGVLSAVISCDTAGAMWNCSHLSDHSVYDNITGNVYSAFRNSVCYSNYTYICRKHTKHWSRENNNDITEINTRSIIPDCLSLFHTHMHACQNKEQTGLNMAVTRIKSFPLLFLRFAVVCSLEQKTNSPGKVKTDASLWFEKDVILLEP